MKMYCTYVELSHTSVTQHWSRQYCHFSFSSGISQNTDNVLKWWFCSV